MDLFHRVMGIAAWFAWAAARYSINFVPFLAFVVIGLGFATFAAGNELRYALTNGSEPHASTVGATHAAATEEVEGRFVQIPGELAEGVVFQYTEERRGRTTVKASYFALLDDDGKHALLVRTAGSQRPVDKPGPTTLLGMLMPIDTKLQKELDASRGSFGEVEFDRRFVLELGRRPGQPAVWAGVAAACGVALLALLTAWSRRYVIFRGDPGAVVASVTPPADEGIPVLASGTFTLGAHQKRFPWCSAGVIAADGHLVVLANIDASSHFMGIKTKDRAGVWAIDLAVDGLPELELGYQYYGRRRLPAVRVFHSDGRKQRTSVLACEDENVRAMLVAFLGTQPPPPVGSDEPAASQA